MNRFQVRSEDVTDKNKVDGELQEMLRKAREMYHAMTPEQREAHDEAQRASFVRAMLPTGDPRFD